MNNLSKIIRSVILGHRYLSRLQTYCFHSSELIFAITKLLLHSHFQGLHLHRLCLLLSLCLEQLTLNCYLLHRHMTYRALRLLPDCWFDISSFFGDYEWKTVLETPLASHSTVQLHLWSLFQFEWILSFVTAHLVYVVKRKYANNNQWTILDIQHIWRDLDQALALLRVKGVFLQVLAFFTTL